jgi:predicted TIM-barrel fold metal-dependent hydrolase
MIIDSLTHVTPDGRWFATRHDASVDRLLREMDKAGTDKAVVVALADHIENNFVARTCASHADRLIAGASINPAKCGSAKQAAAEARALLSDGEFRVLKLHPRWNGYDPLDPRCLGMLEEIASFPKPVPIWLDTIFRNRTCLLRKPPMDAIEELAQRFPSLRIVLLHGGGSLLLQVAELIREHPNLTIDLSLTILYYRPSSLQEDIAFVLAKRDRRAIAGSDFPEFCQSEYISAIQRAASDQALSEEKITGVLGRNLSHLLE